MNKKLIRFADYFLNEFLNGYILKVCHGDTELERELQISLLYNEVYIPIDQETIESVQSAFTNLNNIDDKTEQYIIGILSRFQNYNLTVEWLNQEEIECKKREDWLQHIISLCMDRVNSLLAHKNNELNDAWANKISIMPSFLMCLYISHKYTSYFSKEEIGTILSAFKSDIKRVDNYFNEKTDSEEYTKLESDTLHYFGQKYGSILLNSLDEDYFNTIPIVKSVLEKYNHKTIRDSLRDPAQVIQKLKSFGYITYENGKITISDILFWFYASYNAYISNQIDEIFNTEEKHLKEIDEKTAKIIKLESEVRKLTEENKILSKENNSMFEKLKEIEGNLNDKIENAVSDKQLIINRLQDTIDKLYLKDLKDITDEIENEEINIFTDFINYEPKALPDVVGKSILFVGGRLKKDKLEEIFSASKVTHISCDEIALLRNKPEVDQVIFFTDVNTHAMFNLIKTKYKDITYINNSSQSYLKSLLEG